MKGRLIARSVLFLSLGTMLSVSLWAQEDSRYQKYLQEMEELEKATPQILKEQGREGFIRRYRDFIDRHPGFDKNIYLETRIAQAWEWHTPEKNEPQDLAKAVEVYLSIIERYDNSHPYMKQVKLFAADRSADLDPEMSAKRYRSLIEEYPDDDGLRLRCYWALGRNAKKRGKKREAEEYYSLVLMYDPTALTSPETISAVQRAQHNAAVGLFWLAVESDEPPEMQLLSLNAQIKKYPQIEGWLWGMVYDFRRDLEERMRKPEEEFFQEILEKSLTELPAPKPEESDLPVAEVDVAPPEQSSSMRTDKERGRGQWMFWGLGIPLGVGVVVLGIIVILLRQRKG